MTKAVFAGMERTQNPMGRSDRVAGRLPCRERLQKGTTAVESAALTKSAKATTIIAGKPVTVTGGSIQEILAYYRMEENVS